MVGAVGDGRAAWPYGAVAVEPQLYTLYYTQVGQNQVFTAYYQTRE